MSSLFVGDDHAEENDDDDDDLGLFLLALFVQRFAPKKKGGGTKETSVSTVACYSVYRSQFLLPSLYFAQYTKVSVTDLL